MTAILLDGNNALCRVAFIRELQQLKTSIGLHTGPPFGFLRVLRATLERFKASSCIVVWDCGRSALRTQLYPEYKANRDEGERPEALKHLDEQKGIVQGILPYLNVKQASFKGYEGDDLLYLFKQMAGAGNAVVVTDDKDLLQLVDETTAVYRPIAGDIVSFNNFETYTGIPLNLFILRKALVGDKSDNITGVNGVGEKTADKFLKEVYCEDDKWAEGKIDSALLLNACKEHKSKTAKKIVDGWDIVERNLKLVDLSSIHFEPPHFDRARSIIDTELVGLTTDIELMQVLGKYEFFELTRKFVQWILPFRRLS